jgi:RNA polymerase sigma-70 factor, ECF subfamily
VGGEGLTEYVCHVYRFARRLTGDHNCAEDLTQETYLRAFRSRSQLRDGQSARPWLFRIAANLWNDELRRNRGGVRQATSLEVEVVGAAAGPEIDIENKESLVEALALLDALPDRQRTVLYLVAVEELSISEVCDILDINASTAKANLSIARKQMREKLSVRMRNES